jgi:multiple sugar transport system permease protein
VATTTLRRQEHRWAYVFMSPWLLGMVAFTAGPMVISLVLSFADYDMVNPPRLIGADNYAELVHDPKVATAVWNTLFYTALHVPSQIVLALALAALLHRVRRGAGVFRTLLYLPVMTPPVAMAAMFLLLLNGSSGLLNEVLGFVGIDGPAWTTDPAWLKPSLVIMGLWTVGSTTVIYLAAMSSVPEELYEAARLDGAGPWHQFRHVTLPMISGAVYFTTVVNTIASLQMFTEAYAMFFGADTMTRGGSDAALFYVIYMFQEAFRSLRLGYASALAWLLFLIIMVITIVQVRLSRRLVHYAGER